MYRTVVPGVPDTQGGTVVTDLKCHFDANGWLQGPVVIGHLLTPNRYSSGFGTGRGVVMHTEDGYETGTVSTFMNPASQVSAFFSIAQDGSCHQYLPVGKGMVAWSQAAGNEAWRGIEDEDRTHPSIPFTSAQITAFAQILEACSAYDGFPLQITDDPVNGHGLITHGDGGVAWGDHPDCPGDVRKAQRPQIIALAMSIRQGTAPPPAQDWTDAMIASLPTLIQGSADKAGVVQYVRRMQALVKVIGDVNKLPAASSVAVTGTYDRTTWLGVLAVQKMFGLTQDGAVGPATWGALVAGQHG
jgi:peptidoglycan hydrolase-like protein with peptidoglycan-binding domain